MHNMLLNQLTFFKYLFLINTKRDLLMEQLRNQIHKFFTILTPTFMSLMQIYEIATVKWDYLGYITLSVVFLV